MNPCDSTKKIPSPHTRHSRQRRSEHTTSQAAGTLDAELGHLLHLGLLNCGVLITPFHNMMLTCPQTTNTDVQRLLHAFDQVLEQITPAS